MSIRSVDFPPPETPVTQVKAASGIEAVTFFRLLPVAPVTVSFRVFEISRRCFGDFDLQRAGKILSGERARVFHDVLRRAFGDDLAAVDAGRRADVDHVVGLKDRLLVVLDHDHRVAEVAEVLQRFEQARVVALVQADRGLVQHIEHAGQA